jgi:hypothetical protein
MTRAALAVLLLCGVAGCPTPPAPAEPDLARAAMPKMDQPLAAAPPAAAPPGAAPAAAPPTAAKPAMPVTAEVEIGGKVDNRPDFKGDVRAWVTDGPCWQPATRALGTSKAQPDGSFFIEVFVPQGTPLWVCAATADGSASGALEKTPLLGKGLGEVTFTNQHLTLKKGKRVTAPPPKTEPPAAK